MASLRASSLPQSGFETVLWATFHLVRREVEAVRRWRDRRLARAALAGLDDPSLKDLGFDRSEISSLVSDTSGDRIRLYDPDWRRGE